MTSTSTSRAPGGCGSGSSPAAQSAVFVPALLRLHDRGRFPFTDLTEYSPLDQLEMAVAASAAGEVDTPVLLLDQPTNGPPADRPTTKGRNGHALS